MIKNDRPEKPKALQARKIQRTLNNLREKVKREKITNKDIPSYWSDAREELYNMHHGKCCYCERKRDKAREPDIEHYRPKCEVTEDESHPGYWWLAYDWDNLLWSCKTCNEDKKLNHFPLEGDYRARNEGDDLSKEAPLLLNPAIDDCEQHFLYDWSETDGLFVKIYAKDIEGRGKKTINILDLNRLDLLLERSSHIKYILKPIAIGLHVSRDQSGLEEKKQENIAKLKEVISPESQFSGLAKYYFKLFHLSEYF